MDLLRKYQELRPHSAAFAWRRAETYLDDLERLQSYFTLSMEQSKSTARSRDTEYPLLKEKSKASIQEIEEFKKNTSSNESGIEIAKSQFPDLLKYIADEKVYATDQRWFFKNYSEHAYNRMEILVDDAFDDLMDLIELEIHAGEVISKDTHDFSSQEYRNTKDFLIATKNAQRKFREFEGTVFSIKENLFNFIWAYYDLDIKYPSSINIHKALKQSQKNEDLASFLDERFNGNLIKERNYTRNCLTHHCHVHVQDYEYTEGFYFHDFSEFGNPDFEGDDPDMIPLVTTAIDKLKDIVTDCVGAIDLIVEGPYIPNNVTFEEHFGKLWKLHHK